MKLNSMIWKAKLLTISKRMPSTHSIKIWLDILAYLKVFNLSEFSNLAFGLLEKCFKEDRELTHQLLTYDLTNWSHWTCLSLDVCSNLKEFVSHTACQMLIADLWLDGLKIRKNLNLKVIIALMFSPAIFAIRFKSARELQYMP